jgi:truncated hemoglobin YjbI
MPTKIRIAAPLRDALLECFAATARLAQPELRSQIVLVGVAASIAHNSE